MIHYTESTQTVEKQDRCNIYVIIETMCPLGHHHNGFVAIHAAPLHIAGTSKPGVLNETKKVSEVILDDTESDRNWRNKTGVICM